MHWHRNSQSRLLKALFVLTAFVMIAVIPAAARADDKKDEIKKAPAFSSKGIWLQAGKIKKKKIFADKLTLVYFWDYSTINVIREIKYLNDWYKAYHPYGFEIILVHAPEFEYGHDKDNVEAALNRMNLPYPTYLDNDGTVWQEYGNGSWPTKHLVDSKGRILYSQVGEGNYITAEEAIRKGLQELNPEAALPPSVVHSEQDKFNLWECGEMSTEVYVGYKRAGWWGVEIANLPGAQPDQTLKFEDQGRRLERGFFLKGLWSNREEYFEHAETVPDYEDYMGIIYLGRELYAVMDQMEKGKTSRVYVRRDDEPVPEANRGTDLKVDEKGDTYVEVSQPRLYYIIAGEDKEFHELKLMVKDDKLAVYVFSFSNQCLSDFDHL
ncbi:MAG TPA: redoxin domain-containing protein [Verrucomicrobiae bacterium]|jgi:hypothetical protein|nr:redoxin domain-containing protein [Verrucomicrobiae bacterium]